jgi:predicted TPR repeat methyltransferase
MRLRDGHNGSIGNDPNPFPVSWKWLWEFVSGVWHRFFGLLWRAVPNQDPTEYFRRLNSAAYEEHHLAGNDDLFGAQCLALLKPVVDRLAGLRLLDLGCGDAAFVMRLPVDDAEVTIVDCCRPRLQVAYDRLSVVAKSVIMLDVDLRQWHPAVGSEYDLVLAINVIPYINDLQGLLRICEACVTAGGSLLVAGPVRSCVWEDEFEGVRVVFHRPDDVNRAAAAAGFKLLELRWIGFRVPFLGWPVIVGFVELFTV